MKKDNIDYIGKKFNELTVVDIIKSDKTNDNHKYAICKCSCGKTIKTRLSLLKKGQESCGCKAIESRIKRQTKHGDFGKRLYRIWNGILSRTKYKCNHDKIKYWGRGIKVCKEWEEYENFKKWALQNGYNENLTIDRIDVDGDYSPKNCRWATRKEQQNNRRNTRWIIYKGIKKSIIEWCEILGLNRNTISSRYNYGMRAPEIFERPIKKVLHK